MNRELKNNQMKQKLHSCSINVVNMIKRLLRLYLMKKYEQERLVCVDCIPNITTKQLITLEEANKMWQIHKGEIYESNYKFLNDIEQKQQQIQAIISKYQERERVLQYVILQLFGIQNKDIKTKQVELESSNNKKQLMQMEQKELKLLLIYWQKRMEYHKQKNYKRNQIQKIQSIQRRLFKNQMKLNNFNEIVDKNYLNSLK